MMNIDYGYQQPTVFDRGWLAARQGLGQLFRQRGQTVWGAGFVALALVFHLIGVAFLVQALLPAALPGGARLAPLGSALLAFGVAWHFGRCAWPLLPARIRCRAQAQRRTARPSHSGQAAPSAAVLLDPAITRMPPDQRRACLAELRAVGVNVSIARALVSAGLGSEAALQRASDTDILAIRGVGPATLRKIRVCFDRRG